MYKVFLRPLLFRFGGDAAHNITMSLMRIAGSIPLARPLIRFWNKVNAPSLQREVFGLNFPNPVGLAAGLDKNCEQYNLLSDYGFGFIEVGSLTPEPQPGNPKPRIFRIPKDKAIVNRMGINNKGVRHAIARIQSDPPSCIISASIARNTKSTSDQEVIRDYRTAFSLLYDFVDMITVNISCPNVEGMSSLEEVSFLSEVLDELLSLRLCYDKYKPVLVKVSPDIEPEQLDNILDYCMMSGIDGVVATNTTRSRAGLSVHPQKISDIGNGGLSGAPLYNKSIQMVRHIKEYTGGRLPIVGCGGIMTPEQAAEMLDAGASLIQVYTGFIYEGPALVRKIKRHLRKLSTAKS